MSESSFSADLDALVRGESVSSNDELTRFASELYGEEQNVTMPNALKLRIANNLGLPEADEPTALSAPVSRRTMRAAEPQQRRGRPWAIALTLAAAVLLVLTGILRFGMPTNNNEPDNQFLMAPTAVPTIAATPDASPESNEWIVPFSDADCPEDELLDRGEWMDVQNERAATYTEAEQRVDEPYDVPDTDDAEAVAERHRQSMACLNLNSNDQVNSDALPIESPRKAWENSAQADETREDRFYDRLERSKALSSYVENDLGLTADDLVRQTDGEPGLIWGPSHAVEMADGRIVLLPGWATNSQDDMAGFEGFAPVWQNIEGEWLLDEELLFCIGECDEYWEQRESVYPDQATPPASPESTSFDEQLWLEPITPEECVIEDTGELPDASPEDFDAFPDREYSLVGPADPVDANAANEVVRQSIACQNPVSLQSDRFATESALASEGFSPISIVMSERWLADGIDLSAQLEEQGVTATDALDAPVAEMNQPVEAHSPHPDMMFALDDGRIISVVASTASTQSNMVGTGFLLTNENDEWRIDQVVPVCLGQCGAVFSEMEELNIDAAWLSPISTDECVESDYLPADFSQEEAAASRSRQYRACETAGDVAPLQGPDFRVTEGGDARPLSDEIATLHSENDENPGSLQQVAHTSRWAPEQEFPTEPWDAFHPNSVVMLEDGRVAVLESTVAPPDGSSGRTSPVVTTALIWDVEGDSWMLDEEVTVCLGNCDSFWDDEAAGSESTPEALALPEICEVGGEFAADFTSHDQLPIQLRPGPGDGSGAAVEIIPPRTSLEFLCEAEETSNPSVDRMNEGDEWLQVRTEDGTEGWIREVDVREIEP